MNIDKEPVKKPQDEQQGKLDFGTKSYLGYSDENRSILVESIRNKRNTKEPFSPEEIEFMQAEQDFLDDQPDYGK